MARINHEIVIIAVSAILLSAIPIVEIPWLVGFACAVYLAGIWILYEYKYNAGWLYYSKWLLVWYIIYIVLTPIGLYFNGDTTEIDTFDYVPASMVLSAFGFSWFLIGIKKSINNYKLSNQMAKTPSSFVSRSILVLLVWLAIVLQKGVYSGVVSRAIGDQTFYIILVPSLVLIVMNDFNAWKAKRLPIVLFVAPGIASLLLSTDLQETKERMFLLTAFPLFLGYLMSKFYNWKTLVIVGGFTVFVFIATFPIVDAVRTAVGKSGELVNVVEVAKSITKGEIDVRWDYILHRLAVIQYLAGVVKNEANLIPQRPSNPEWILYGPLP